MGTQPPGTGADPGRTPRGAGAPPDPSRERPGPRGVALRLAVVLGLVALDLWSKEAVFELLAQWPETIAMDRHGHLRLPLLGEWLAFMQSTNRGMAWGFDKLPLLLLVVGRVAAVLFLLVLVVRTPRRARLLGASMVLILAGAAGNLADNLFLGPRDGERFGAVRDFIDVYFPIWDWHFPTFNVADACISVGAVLLILSSFLAPREPAAPGPETGPAR